jgi:hypothetical protein
MTYAQTDSKKVMSRVCMDGSLKKSVKMGGILFLFFFFFPSENSTLARLPLIKHGNIDIYDIFVVR